MANLDILAVLYRRRRGFGILEVGSHLRVVIYCSKFRNRDEAFGAPEHGAHPEYPANTRANEAERRRAGSVGGHYAHVGGSWDHKFTRRWTLPRGGRGGGSLPGGRVSLLGVGSSSEGAARDGHEQRFSANLDAV